MFMRGNQEFFAIYATFGFTGRVQALARRNMKIYKIQTMMNPGTVPASKSWSSRRPAPMSPGHPLKMLFDHPGDVPI